MTAILKFVYVCFTLSHSLKTAKRLAGITEPASKVAAFIYLTV